LQGIWAGMLCGTALQTAILMCMVWNTDWKAEVYIYVWKWHTVFSSHTFQLNYYVLLSSSWVIIVEFQAAQALERVRLWGGQHEKLPTSDQDVVQ
jgi:multidrug resistance protein, MATE family